MTAVELARPPLEYVDLHGISVFAHASNSLVVQASHGQVDGRARHPARLSEAMKAATFAISSSVISRRAWVLLASSSCHCSQVIPDASARGPKASLIVRVSGMRLWPQSDHADAVRRELGGQIPGERLLGGLRRTVAAHQRDARREWSG